MIAVTDHNRIDFALELQKELGDAIIVGEEITALEGEIIGLYLTEVIPAGLSAIETTQRIHAQGGLVYIPHPFETVRKGLPLAILNEIADQVDIIETYNGRSMQNRASKAGTWASEHYVPGAASSDAHGRRGWGNTYSILAEEPTKETLVALIANATYNTQSTGLVGRLYPKLNRLRKAI
jgi:predicted metal-dependent phosphoesterase TrpH